MTSLLHLIFGHIKMNKVQSASIVLAVVLSVMTVFASLLLYKGLNLGADMQKQRSGADIIAVPLESEKYIDVKELLFTGAPMPIYVSESIEADITKIDGVKSTISHFFSQTLDASCCSANAATRLIGTDISNDWLIQPFMSRPIDHLADDECIVGSKIGGDFADSIILYNKQFKIIDKLAESGSDIDNSIIISKEMARNIAYNIPGNEYYWEKYGPVDTLISSVMIKTNEHAEMNRIINKINIIPGVKAIEQSRIVEDSQKNLESLLKLVFIFGILVLILASLQLISRFYTSAWDRKVEFALYKSLGASNKDLAVLVGGEAFLLTFSAFLIGGVGGYFFFRFLLDMFMKGNSFPFIMPDNIFVLSSLLTILLVLLVLVCISVTSPILQTKRIEPAEAMKQGDID